jgi:hypothetical protein
MNNTNLSKQNKKFKKMLFQLPDVDCDDNKLGSIKTCRYLESRTQLGLFSKVQFVTFHLFRN